MKIPRLFTIDETRILCKRHKFYRYAVNGFMDGNVFWLIIAIIFCLIFYLLKELGVDIYGKCDKI